MRPLSRLIRYGIVLAMSAVLLAALSSCADKNVEVKPKGQVVVGGSVGG